MDEPYICDETTVVLECAGTEFRLKGRKVEQMGWQRIWQAFRGSIGGRAVEDEEDKTGALPEDLKEIPDDGVLFYMDNRVESHSPRIRISLNSDA